MKKRMILALALLIGVTLAIGVVAEDQPTPSPVPTEAAPPLETTTLDNRTLADPLLDLSALLNSPNSTTELMATGPKPIPTIPHIDCSQYNDAACTWEWIPNTCCCRAVTGTCQEFCE